MTGRRPTIIDVAQKAGVSKSTVSLVLRNSPAVRAETRDEVRKAMAELGYVYNRAAATLRGSGAGLIGLVINDLRNPFFTEFAISVQMALTDKGFATVLANTDEDTRLQAQVIAAMIEHGVSAIIVSPAYGADDGGFDAISRAGIPALQVLRQADRSAPAFPFMAPDYPAGGRIATRHLLEGRPNRVAFIGGLEGRGVTLERNSGYHEVLAQAGMAPLVLPGRASRAFGREAARLLTRAHPEVDAALCFNDLVAMGLVAGCAEIGRAVGAGGLRVVGFDDIEECGQIWPPLSSVSCDIAGFGAAAASTMLAWLIDGTVPPPKRLSPVEMRVRASSAIGQPERNDAR
ncbi:LacI family DNA-binding transcriptional regulator [Rhodobacteraceae bacterium 2CG4]|uniref:LacI family DNA-binding transcriptional regulator n=1 Tax=Halovulum marinum TaxID=2662447 RepID=A0A6L5Z2Q3_9RHOB|nr:LacI family DNA-binding transcriptional regulator [Halovulum marinum]MSU90365.1 LacI family DNA-binding transcriptional regulator [Halovulum marinum]